MPSESPLIWHPDSGIVVPGVHWQWCGERLNVQDYIDGIGGRDLDAVREAGLNTHVIAQRGTRAILEMILEHGFFHADPHPGNVKYLPGDQIALLDFGMVGRLSDGRRHEVAELLHGLVKREAEVVARILLDWSADSDADSERLAGDIAEFIDNYHGVPLEQLDMSAMIGEMTSVLRRHHLLLPADLVLMLKAFITPGRDGAFTGSGFRLWHPKRTRGREGVEAPLFPERRCRSHAEEPGRCRPRTGGLA